MERKRSRAKADTARTVDLDLTTLEQPTGREYFYGSDAFNEMLGNKSLEELIVKGKFEKLGTISARIHARPLSPVPLALTGFLGNLVLHVTGAPEWAQLGVILLPWAIGFSLAWVVSKALERRRDVPVHTAEPTPSQATTSVPSKVSAPAPADT